jgi:hypothetical protein
VNDVNNNSGNTQPKRKWLFPLGVAAIAISSVVVVSCFHDDDPTTVAFDDGGSGFLPEEPLPIEVSGTSLACDAVNQTTGTAIASGLVVEAPDSIQAINISQEEAKTGLAASEARPNAGNTIKRLAVIVPGQTPDGTPAVDDLGDPIGDVRPLIVSYAEQVVGDYELGDGSADIGDPFHLDDIFASLSLDNGASWKKVAVGETAVGKGNYKTVTWDGVENTPYGGHSHKPTMAAEGNKILVAWNDKYCPSGNPFDLEDPATEDYYQVNGSQGSINYGLDGGPDGTDPELLAPNGKELYEVPFSCVWTARGILREDPLVAGVYGVEWRQAQQMTSGTRDSNKIWIAAQDIGFAIAWQEDTEGLRSGKGAGPGEGYSGATTNHGTDIWYTHITMADFDDVCTDVDCTTTTDDIAEIAALAEKPKPAINYAYPVRITNNEACSESDFETKPWCADNCVSTASVTSNNQSDTSITRCVQDDLDYMTADASIAPAAAVLDGDTGASRPALSILKTNATPPEYITVLAYEETKGLSESDPGDQGTAETDIALEGKSVYFESFFWDQPVTVSAGRIVNLRVPGATVDSEDNVTLTGLDIYENARRVVIINQVDTCQMSDGDYPFGLMYKQGFSTQGGASDMYIRMNTGFTYDEFEATAANVSARETVYDDAGKVTAVSWTEDNLLDQSYDNPLDNTFSPRAFLRGGDIYTGFEYTPNWRQTASGTTPNNFWIHRYIDAAWKVPQQVTDVSGARVSTLDPRFFSTPEGFATSLASDNSDPRVLFISYGTFDMETGTELDLFYSRSTDRGETWEVLDGADNRVLIPGFDGIGDTTDEYSHAKLATKTDVEEKEVQALSTADGTMLFNVWLQETETLCADPWCGLESRSGVVNYDTVAP